MKPRLFLVALSLAAQVLLVAAAPAGATEPTPPECGTDIENICPEPPPPPPPPSPPEGDPWSPTIVPGDGYGDWHPTPGDGWQFYGSRCFARELMRSSGSGPWTRRLFLYTVWCGRSGKITYRSSSVRTDHDTFCWNSSGPYATRTYGGANYSLVEVQAWVAVSCASIPTGWPNFNDSLMMRVQYFPHGAYRTVAWN